MEPSSSWMPSIAVSMLRSVTLKRDTTLTPPSPSPPSSPLPPSSSPSQRSPLCPPSLAFAASNSSTDTVPFSSTSVPSTVSSPTPASTGSSASTLTSSSSAPSSSSSSSSSVSSTSWLPLSAPAARVVSATVGSIVTTLSVIPLDVVKTRMQASPALAALSTPSALRTIVKADGVKALYAGMRASLLGAVPNVVLYYATYDTLHVALRDCVGYDGVLANLSPLFAGSIARLIAATVISPLELVKTKQQAAVGPSNMFASLRQEVAIGGVRRLWTGLGPTLLRDVPFSGMYWLMFETLHKSDTMVNVVMPRLPDGLAQTFVPSFLAGASAGTIAAYITCPFDVVKTHVQAGTSSASVPTLTALRIIFKNEGLAGVFAGAGPRCARVAPACAVMIASYDVGKALLM